MSASLRALLAGVVDYAGLFPPASLSLEESVRNYAAYRKGTDAWMLGRFICPVGRLTELASFGDDLIAVGDPWPLSVLGRGGNTLDGFLDASREDLVTMASFPPQQASRFRIEAFEVRRPPRAFPEEQDDDLLSLMAVDDLKECFSRLLLLTWYFEVPLGTNWSDTVLVLIVALTALDLGKSTGIKLRTGGLEPAAFPTSEQIAFTIAACCQSNVALKFTAGLHHPIRHFDGTLQTMMHGFLNVFVAGVLAHARGLRQEQVQKIIEDEDVASFRFSDAGLAWRDFHASVEEITAARRKAVISFGSCSFDEPREDLRALGLLQ